MSELTLKLQLHGAYVDSDTKALLREAYVEIYRLMDELERDREWAIGQRRRLAILQLEMCTNDFIRANPAPWEEQ